MSTFATHDERSWAPEVSAAATQPESTGAEPDRTTWTCTDERRSETNVSLVADVDPLTAVARITRGPSPRPAASTTAVQVPSGLTVAATGSRPSRATLTDPPAPAASGRST